MVNYYLRISSKAEDAFSWRGYHINEGWLLDDEGDFALVVRGQVADEGQPGWELDTAVGFSLATLIGPAGTFSHSRGRRNKPDHVEAAGQQPIARGYARAEGDGFWWHSFSILLKIFDRNSQVRFAKSMVATGLRESFMHSSVHGQSCIKSHGHAFKLEIPVK